MPTLKGTEVSLYYVQCFLYLLSSSINASVFHNIWLDTFWMDLYIALKKIFLVVYERILKNKIGKTSIVS